MYFLKINKIIILLITLLCLMALAIELFCFYSAIATDDSEIALFTKLSILDSAVSRL